jgi:hypothetical protein
MTRRNWLGMMVGWILVGGTQGGYAMASRPAEFGVVVSSGLMQGEDTKYGVEIKSNSGRHLAGFASLRSRNGPGVGQTSGYGGIGLPEWVEVSWREPIYGKKFIPSTGNTIDVLDFGRELGRFRVEVASRIPVDVLRYASAERGRAIKLMFRLLDDDVVLGWCVQEPSKLGGGWLFSHFGGDFKPANWVQGAVTEKGWYVNRKTGQRVDTDTGH